MAEQLDMFGQLDREALAAEIAIDVAERCRSPRVALIHLDSAEERANVVLARVRALRASIAIDGGLP